ncbi:MAG: hypothetical protein LBH07_00360, partial [Treponema sp.]|nr:hypothetical protein [Treponema sp.]
VYNYGRFSFSSFADDRVVRLVQGPIRELRPALIINSRGNSQWEMELYFAKIDGKWVIIR